MRGNLLKAILCTVSLVLFMLTLGFGDLKAQAITVGKVSMTGQVTVKGPGGAVYTGTEGEAPVFPGTSISVKDGKAMVDVAGKGSISMDKNSLMTFSENGVPNLTKGNFQVKVLPGQKFKFMTPKGKVVLQATDKPSMFSFVVTEKGIKVRGSGMIFAGGKSFAPGEILTLGSVGAAGGAMTGALIGAGILAAAGAGAAIAASSGGGGGHHHASPSKP